MYVLKAILGKFETIFIKEGLKKHLISDHDQTSPE